MHHNDGYFESEIKEKIIEELSHMYGLDKEQIFKYTFLRYLIANDIKIDLIDKELKDLNNFTEFIIQELKIKIFTEPPFYKYVVYKDTNQYINSFNYSLSNIFESIYFKESLVVFINKSGKDIGINGFFKEQLQSIIRFGKSKSRLFKNNVSFNDINKKFCIDKLNKIFGVKLNEPKIIKGFEYNLDEFLFTRSLESKLEAIYLAVRLNPNSNNRLLSEKDIENKLKYNLHLIDNDLKLVDSQYTIDNSIIDILAIDSNDVYYVIEVKNCIDERMVYQSILYPLSLSKELNVSKDKVKSVIVSTEYNYELISVFEELSNNNMHIDLYKADIEFKGKGFNLQLKNIL